MGGFELGSAARVASSDHASAGATGNLIGGFSLIVTSNRGPVARPNISRRPSLFTATTIMIATDTIRPAWRNLT